MKMLSWFNRHPFWSLLLLYLVIEGLFMLLSYIPGISHFVLDCIVAGVTILFMLVLLSWLLSWLFDGSESQEVTVHQLRAAIDTEIERLYKEAKKKAQREAGK